MLSIPSIVKLFLLLISVCFRLDVMGKRLDPFPEKEMLALNFSTKQVSQFYRSRRLLEEQIHSEPSRHHMSWRAYEEVDGLKNTEVAIFISSTTNEDERFLWQRVIPSVRTWMRMLKHVYVIVEDNFMIRFALRHCRQHDWKGYTSFECHNEANYLLTRKCTNEYYVANGACCKVDAMLDFLINENKELFDQIKYAFNGDDDSYFRVDQILKWLAAVDKSGVNTFPIVGNAAHTHVNHGMWHINGCKEIRATGWYQPFVINKEAMKKMAIASAAYGLTETCKIFDVSQDVGIEGYVWLFGLYHIMIPNVEINGEHKGSDVFTPKQLIVHGLKQDKDHCRAGQEKDWPEKDKYDQRLVIGCGDIDHQNPFHNSKDQASMYDAFQYFRDHGEQLQFGIEGQYEWKKRKVILYPRESPDAKIKIKEILPLNIQLPPDGKYHGEEVTEALIPTLEFIDGYDKTKHGKKHDIVNKKWVVFGPKDCDPPGKIGG